MRPLQDIKVSQVVLNLWEVQSIILYSQYPASVWGIPEVNITLTNLFDNFCFAQHGYGTQFSQFHLNTLGNGMSGGVLKRSDHNSGIDHNTPGKKWFFLYRFRPLNLTNELAPLNTLPCCSLPGFLKLVFEWQLFQWHPTRDPGIVHLCLLILVGTLGPVHFLVSPAKVSVSLLRALAGRQEAILATGSDTVEPTSCCGFLVGSD